MKTKTKALALVPASSAIGNLPATQPPPRKSDIICALVERARVKHQEESAALTKRRTEAEKAAKDAILKELKDHPDNFDVSVYPSYLTPQVNFYIKGMPPHIKKLKAAIGAVPSVRNFDPSAVKRDITSKLSGGIAGDRVKALLASPDAVKKLDATLEALSV